MSYDAFDDEAALIEQLEEAGAVGRIFRDEETGAIVSEVGEAGAVYVKPTHLFATWRERRPVAPRSQRRPRERRGSRRVTRAGPSSTEDPSPEPPPDLQPRWLMTAARLLASLLVTLEDVRRRWSR